MAITAAKRFLICSAALVSLATPSMAWAQEREFDLPAQSATQSIPEFARQAGIQIVAPGEKLRGVRTPRLRGSYDVRDALALLLRDTKLRIISDEGTIITLGAAESQVQPAAPSRGETASSPEEIENREIVVTGTNLRRLREEGTSNYIEIDREDIERSGQPTIARYLKTLPQNFGGAVESGSTAGLVTPNLSAGAAVSLRGLGAGSTLTLINGRRLPAASGSLAFFSDVSSIPVSAVERIEVLPDSASAIYGADAVAGVVNIILRKDFEGLEATLSGGIATRGGYEEGRISVVGGDSWSTGRIFFALEHYRQGELRALERDFSSSNDLTRFGGSDLRTNISSPGNIFDATGAGLPGLFQSIPGVPFPVPVFAIGIPRGQDGRSLTVEDFEARVGQPLNVTDLAPFSTLVPAQEITSFTGSLEQSVNDKLRFTTDILLGHRHTTSLGGIYGFQALVPETNPFNPFDAPVIVQTFLPELGPVQLDRKINTASLAAGLEARFGDWRVRGSLGYGVDETVGRGYNSVDEGRLAELLANTDPAATINLFGDGTGNSPEQLDAVRIVDVDRLRATLATASILADGDLVRIPGGDVQVAIGAEYRRETFTTQDFEPSRNARAIFGEILVPLFGTSNARPGLRRLELSGAFRFDDYSDVGQETTPRLGIVWEPVKDLILRGSYSRSFRAPNLFEAAPPERQAFIPFADPLRGGEVSTVEILQGARDDLRPERAESWSAGIAWRPTFIPRFRIGLDYFRTSYTDRITQPDFASLLIDPVTYAAYQRRAQPTPEDIAQGFPGRLELVDLRSVNAAATEIEGFDLQATWGLATAVGDWDFSFNGTYNTKYDQVLIAGAPVTDRLATLGYPVKFRLRGGLTWSRGAVSASAFVNHTDGYRDTNLGPHTRVESYTTADLSLQWEPTTAPLTGTRFQLAIANLFDADPPFVNQTEGYDANVSDPRGRMIRLTIAKSL